MARRKGRRGCLWRRGGKALAALACRSTGRAEILLGSVEKNLPRITLQLKNVPFMRIRVSCRLTRVVIVLWASGWAFVACVAAQQKDPAKAAAAAKEPEQMCAAPNRLDLAGEWTMQSSFLEPGAGPHLSQPGFTTTNWHRVQVPTTVLNALTSAGVYPDLRIGMNAYRIPDSSDDFNAQHDLAKFSHLPDKRNPWRDPWWFRRGFTLPQGPADRHVWLHFDSINYRAEVWLNGNKVADREQMVSMNQRFVFDVSRWAVAGPNCLAVKIWPVDHVGSPGPQLVPLADNRFEDHVSDGPMDFAVQLAGGYDCFPSIPDRYMGILQDVWVEIERSSDHPRSLRGDRTASAAHRQRQAEDLRHLGQCERPGDQRHSEGLDCGNGVDV